MVLAPGALFASDPCVKVGEERNGNQIAVVARLSSCVEVTITLTAELTNMVSSVPLPATLESRGRQELVLARFEPEQPRQPWRYSWRYEWIPGRRLEGPPQPYAYGLPYRDGPHRVLQAARGSFSHAAGSSDEEAIDWEMPEGTKIHPARPGTVVGLRSDVTEGGPDRRFEKDFNYVYVLHEDGTLAEYCHLRPGASPVAVGDKVAVDQWIGFSGNTGFSSTPHLHMAVFSAVDGKKRQTWPMKFAVTGTSASISLEEGKSY
jgi:murein DD-endopeptidase MepM/ murein hydrolase activator NlpD